MDMSRRGLLDRLMMSFLGWMAALLGRSAPKLEDDWKIDGLGVETSEANGTFYRASDGWCWLTAIYWRDSHNPDRIVYHRLEAPRACYDWELLNMARWLYGQYIMKELVIDEKPTVVEFVAGSRRHEWKLKRE